MYLYGSNLISTASRYVHMKRTWYFSDLDFENSFYTGILSYSGPRYHFKSGFSFTHQISEICWSVILYGEALSKH